MTAAAADTAWRQAAACRGSDSELFFPIGKTGPALAEIQRAKDGFDASGEVYDYERGGPGSVLSPYWETDDAVSADTWCYVQGMSYYSTQALLDSFIDRVSKGGTQILNISPMADGAIPSAQQTILLGFGDWLGRFGEAIYSTRAWTVNGEGPTTMGGGTFTGDKAGTAQDIRFTRNQANTVLYATAMGWPVVEMRACNGGPSQVWTLETDGTVQHAGKCLDI